MFKADVSSLNLWETFVVHSSWNGMGSTMPAGRLRRESISFRCAEQALKKCESSPEFA